MSSVVYKYLKIYNELPRHRQRQKLPLLSLPLTVTVKPPKCSFNHSSPFLHYVPRRMLLEPGLAYSIYQLEEASATKTQELHLTASFQQNEQESVSLTVAKTIQSLSGRCFASTTPEGEVTSLPKSVTDTALERLSVRLLAPTVMGWARAFVLGGDMMRCDVLGRMVWLRAFEQC
jgi:hypothetical protein